MNFLNHIFVFITQLVIVASPSTHNDAFYAPFSEVFEVITRKTLVVVFQRRSKYRRSEL